MILMSTHNQQLAARSYQKQFRQLLQAVFQHQAYFRDFFGGNIEALDGVTHNETAFYVKTSDIPVVVGNEYIDRKSTRLNSSHVAISYAVFCLKKKKIITHSS